MKKLILKYNTRVGKNHLPKIEEMTKRLGLKIENVEEGRQGLKVVAITGKLEKLHDMDRELIRHASISRKVS